MRDNTSNSKDDSERFDCCLTMSSTKSAENDRLWWNIVKYALSDAYEAIAGKKHEWFNAIQNLLQSNLGDDELTLLKDYSITI